MKEKIETPHAPKAIGPYSQGVRVGSLVFVSGQLPIDPKNGKINDWTIQGQTKQALENIEAILKEGKLTFRDVVRVEVYLKDMNDFQAMNEIYSQKFAFEIQPVRQAMQVARLPLDALVEISCMAVSSHD